VADRVQEEPCALEAFAGYGDRLSGPTEQRTHAGDKLAGREGLREVIVGTELEPNYLVELGIARREHQDGHIALLPDAAAHLEAVEIGQHDVEEHDVRPALMERLEAAFAVLSRENLEAFLAQRVTERVTQIRVVVDENDPWHLIHRQR